MGSKPLPLLKGALTFASLKQTICISTGLPKPPIYNIRIRKCSSSQRTLASLQPPDVPHLAKTARISLTSNEAAEAYASRCKYAFKAICSSYASVNRGVRTTEAYELRLTPQRRLKLLKSENVYFLFLGLYSLGHLIQVAEFAPKIRQVVDWFGQLQNVDLQSIEPSIRADTEGGNQRNDIPETFENRETMIDAVPVFDESYIKVPKVLNKE